MRFIASFVFEIGRVSQVTLTGIHDALLADGSSPWNQATEHLQAPTLVPRWATYTVIGLLAFWTILIQFYANLALKFFLLIGTFHFDGGGDSRQADGVSGLHPMVALHQMGLL